MEDTETKITVSSISDISSFNPERVITIKGAIPDISRAEAEVIWHHPYFFQIKEDLFINWLSGLFKVAGRLRDWPAGNVSQRQHHLFPLLSLYHH